MTSPQTMISNELKTEADLKAKFQENIAQRQLDFSIIQFSIPSIFTLFPFTTWFPKYLKGGWREGLQKDLFAGLVMGIMLIPQGMAYSMTALLPPEYGFYTSITPSLVYMLLGTCDHLQVWLNSSFLSLDIRLRSSAGWCQCSHQHHGCTGVAKCTACNCARSRERSNDPHSDERVCIAFPTMSIGYSCQFGLSQE